MQRLVPIVLMGLIAVGCGSPQPVGEATYSERAEQAFHEAENALDDGNYIYAASQFRHVRDSFELSSYAIMAELRLADVHFEQGNYRQAAQAYRQFNQLHPSHGAVPYATFRIGMSYYEDMPSDFFLLPPAHERELGSTRSARRALRDFLDEYENSSEPSIQEYVQQADLAFREASDRLAGYEFYVAEFYLERERPIAAAEHLRTMLERFPSATREPEAMFLLARCYVDLSDVESALGVVDELHRLYPDHDLSIEAQEWVERHDLASAR